MKRAAIIFPILIILLFSACTSFSPQKKVLVFSKTDGYVHTSIPDGHTAILKLGTQNGFEVDITDDASVFNDEDIQQYSAVIFLNTSGEVLDWPQRVAFRRYIEAGGAFVGVHGATTTLKTWPWYMDMVGAEFDQHPEKQTATLKVASKDHPSTQHLDDTWERFDEWYNFKWISDQITPLLYLDESSYEGGKHGDQHPISWYHAYDGGRAFYTGLGHTKESYQEEAFLQHLLGGIQYAMDGPPLNYEQDHVMPEESRFEKVVLDYYLNEPMELELLPDGRLIFTERQGKLNIHNPETGVTSVSATFDVYTGQEDGLLGLTLDPNYEKNNWIYVFHSHPTKVEQNISRFTYNPDAEEPLSDQKVVLRIPTQRDECCHSGGSLEFGPDGNLFISAGDDTNPFASDGYNPIDERPGRKPWDAQRTSANTDDLRGKILRITPQNDGSYTIPDGNLFPKDGSKGRPEIYVMGCRNPFRIAIDKRTKYLYWGDVGPDANENGDLRGPMGHDEVNQARGPGFFGWPLFVGDNKAYYEYDFVSKQSGEQYDSAKPINNSPNNSGIQELPPAQPAFIYYPYRASTVFPLMNSGGRNAMAGPVFYQDDYPDNPRRYPKYYDKKLFTYDWMRGIMLENTLDEEGNLVQMERFLPSIEWNNLVDIVMSPEGDMFMIEYGRGWFTSNEDARLVHLKYTSGNRKPKANIEVDKKLGGLPLAVNFDATGSTDPDQDELEYTWNFGGGQTATGAKVTHEFTEAAPYIVELTVKDKSGNEDQAQVKILAGNEPPQINWTVQGNQDFYWEGVPIAYNLEVEDREDGRLGAGIEAANVSRTIEYLEQGYDVTEIAQGHQIVAAKINAEAGLKLMEQSDCQSCHKTNSKSIGPAYTEVAKKYKGQEDALAYLSQKIINGGAGVWGETAMAAHPDISEAKAQAIAEYILSLAPNQDAMMIAAQGDTRLEVPKGKRKDGVFVFIANYMDKGTEEMESLGGQELFTLRSPTIRAEESTSLQDAEEKQFQRADIPQLSRRNRNAIVGNTGATATFGPMDLTGVDGMLLQVDMGAERVQGGEVLVYLDDKSGTPIATLTLANIEEQVDQALKELEVKLPATKGRHQIVIEFKGRENTVVTNLFEFTLTTNSQNTTL
ncbi:MAG: ThuA domain-containing protein [Bacteroidota bacterium]